MEKKYQLEIDSYLKVLRQSNMKKNKDFIYEYSDLNLFHTRVLVKTGIYKDLIFDFASARTESSHLGTNFSFDYILYQKPKEFENIALKENPEFQKFIGDLVIDVIVARRKDKKEHNKLMEAASVEGVQDSKIKIDPRFYPKRHCFGPSNQPQPQVEGMQEF